MNLQYLKFIKHRLNYHVTLYSVLFWCTSVFAQNWNTNSTGNYTQGGLGIGTTYVPTTEKLRVEGKIYTQNLQFSGGSTAGYLLGTNGTTGDVSWLNPATNLWTLNGSAVTANSYLGAALGNTNALKLNTNGSTRLNISGVSTVGTVTVGKTARNPYFWKFEVDGGRTALIGPDNTTNSTYDQTNILQIVSNWNPSSTSTLQNFTNAGSVQHYMSFSHERFTNQEEHGVINCYQYTNPSGPGVPKQLILQKGSGNVGIGNFTTAPTAKLEVLGGDIKTSGDLIYDGNKSVRTTLNTISNQANIWSVNSPHIYYNTGSVGLGTNIPEAKIHIADVTVNSTTDKLLMVGDDSYFTDIDKINAVGIQGKSTPTEAYFQLGNGGMTLWGNQDKLEIGYFSGSNFTKAFKLSKSGTLAVKELCTNTAIDWCDYVFDKNYKLRKLAEVESFITANHHLPEIPSAKEVESNGIKVSEMLTLQMKKIEELTLYIIEQEKRIKSLEAKIKE